MVLYLNDQKKLHPTIPRHHKQIQQSRAGYKINLQNSVICLYTNHEWIEKEYWKTIPFKIASKNQIPRNKLSKGYK
jgi:hypothetical protein